MKRIIICFVSLLVMSLTCQAQHVVGSRIHLEVRYFDPSMTSNQDPRGPIDPPLVYLEDYTLTFEVDHPEYVLYIKDEDDAVVYSTVVSTTVTEVVLPSYLSGDYEIDLVMGDWMFTGWINL